MRISCIVASVREDLAHLDRANLRMNGIMVSDSLSEAFQALLENSSNCMMVTDKIIEEQSSQMAFKKDFEIIFGIYPEQMRIIYIKQGVNGDEISDMMDARGLWDVYYNEQLNNIRTETIIDMVENRKVKERRFSDQLINENKQQIINNANVMVKNLIESLREEKDVTKNEKFRMLIAQYPELVRDVTLTFEEMKKTLSLKDKDLSSLKLKHEKLIEDHRELGESFTVMSQSLSMVEINRQEMLGTMRDLENRYLTLYKTFGEVANLEDVHTKFSKPVNLDDYRGKAPLTVYIKEYTRINYLTTFIEQFSKIAHNALNVVTKVIIIENDSNLMSVPLYQEAGFVYVTDGTNLDKVIIGNLVCVGNNMKLLNYLAHNSLKTDLLFIIDRTYTPKDLIIGDDVIKFGAIKNYRDLKILGIDDVTCITNDPVGHYYLPEIANFDKIAVSDHLKTSALGGLEITKRLLLFIKNWNSVEVISPIVELEDDGPIITEDLEEAPTEL